MKSKTSVQNSKFSSEFTPDIIDSISEIDMTKIIEQNDKMIEEKGFLGILKTALTDNNVRQKPLPKRIRDRNVKNIIALCKLKGKEAKLIELLGDLMEHPLAKLAYSTRSKALPQLKSVVDKKIKKIGWTITHFKRGPKIQPTYQLKN